MDTGWDEGFSNNADAQTMRNLATRLAEFKDMFGDMHDGDRVTINGTGVGVVAGGDFGAALIRVWLGNKPISGKLKTQLLGG